MSASLNAVAIMRQKIRFLINCVKNEPTIRQNHDFMRRLNQIVCQVPITESKESYDKQLLSEYSDSQALNMMASVTKSIGALQSLIEDFNLVS